MVGPGFDRVGDERGPYVPQKAYEFTAFNTINRVIVYGDGSKGEGNPSDRSDGDLASAFEAVHAAASRYEQLFSHTSPGSALAQFNRLGGKPEDVNPELGELIDLALAYSTATDGLFDPTVCNALDVGQKKELNHFSLYAKGQKAPSFERNDRSGVYPIITSLGGIAKGYIADALCELLKQHSIEHAIVNLGGNVKVFGGKPVAGAVNPSAKPAAKTPVQPFTIGLRVPKKYSLGEDSFATVQLTEGAVVTSGIYERGTRAPDGTWHHHIIDPRTGRSAETDLVSASVISESALEADALATALIVMGLERACEFIEEVPGCEAVFVTTSGEVVTTSLIGSKFPFTLL